MKKLVLQIVLFLSLSLFMFQPEKAYASTATGNVEIQNVNTVSGVFDVKITNIDSTDGIQEIYVPVWSKKDQSDIVWYGAKKQSDGTYVVHVDVANHNWNFGTYTVHTYVETLYGNMKIIHATEVNLPMPQNQLSVGTNFDKSIFRANVWNVSEICGKGINEVAFAIWSEENGQDDMQWYTAKLYGDRYYIEAPISNHPSGGEYNVHVYANCFDGNNEFVAAQTIDISNEATASVDISNINTVAGSFDVTVSNISVLGGVQEVYVPVWSKEDQRDLVWYSAEKQADGKYVAHVDVVNHDCNFTNYTVHTYVESGCDRLPLVDATTVNLNTSRAVADIAITEEYSKISLNVSHVPGTLGESLKGISFAVWSEENGQDDLSWYDGQLVGDRYLAETSFGRHSGNGKYTVHVYAQYANGDSKLVAADEIDVISAKANEIKITNLNNVAGTFDVVVSNVIAKNGVREVLVPIWSADNQSDIIWYTAERQSDGTYKVHVDVANHNCNFANYEVHVYVHNGLDEVTYVGAASANVNTPGATATVSMNENWSALSIEAWQVPGTLGASLQGVSFAVWSEENGQDDLRWYTGQLHGDRYVVDASIKNHSGNGTYYVHAYAEYANGRSRLVVADEIDVVSAKVDEIKIANLNNVAGTFDVVLTNVNAKNGVQEVLVPIWGTDNQSDIIWYPAERQSDGTYKVHVDVANHNCNFANYEVHVYVHNGLDEVVYVGATSANVNTPGAITTVSMNESYSEISLDAWRVPGTNGNSLNGVYFAVWSENGGQDDLVWYKGNAVNDHFAVSLDMQKHSDVGLYYVHVYADRPIGRRMVDVITFDRPLTKIMGTSNVTVAQLVKFYNLNEKYPSFYANSDAPTIEAFCQIYVEECAIEGVKVEVAFAQAMLETGFMRYKGDVDISQYNFAGIGATGGGNPGNSFSSVREGVRAQIQHLKAYATSDSLNQPCVDPRFHLVRREAAPYLEWLGIQENPYGTGWATGKDYGYRIRDRYVYRIYEM